MTNSELAVQVKQNLQLHHLWINVEVVPIEISDGSSLLLCRGSPPEQLHPDDSGVGLEWVLAVKTEQKWTIRQWDEVFKGIESFNGKVPARILMAMVTNDSTIVYYFVNSGITKPRKN